VQSTVKGGRSKYVAYHARPPTVDTGPTFGVTVVGPRPEHGSQLRPGPSTWTSAKPAQKCQTDQPTSQSKGAAVATANRKAGGCRRVPTVAGSSKC
jgi:hypothetical protein